MYKIENAVQKKMETLAVVVFFSMLKENFTFSTSHSTTHICGKKTLFFFVIRASVVEEVKRDLYVKIGKSLPPPLPAFQAPHHSRLFL